MTLFSPRLPHVLTKTDLALLLAPTYAREAHVDEELGRERMERALKRPGVADRIYHAVSRALTATQGTRSEDTVMNAMSKAVQRKLGKMEAAPATPALAAVTVLFNIELNLAPAELRTTLETDKGKKLLDQGVEEIGRFLAGQLVR